MKSALGNSPVERFPAAEDHGKIGGPDGSWGTGYKQSYSYMPKRNYNYEYVPQRRNQQRTTPQEESGAGSGSGSGNGGGAEGGNSGTTDGNSESESSQQ